MVMLAEQSIPVPKGPVRIFHVEDDPELSTSMQDFMIGVGDIVLHAGTVAQALKCIPGELTKNGVNVAILDGKLPDGTGEDVANALRASGYPIAIIAFAGSTQTFADHNLNFMKPDVGPVVAAISSFSQPK